MNDNELQHRLAVIEHYDNRVLRVVLNVAKEPVCIVTAYYDRTMSGKPDLDSILYEAV